MRSFKFPKMFESNSSRIWREDELQSERGELECDPYFGILLKHYMFNQNSYILKDMLIDTIYTQIAIFLPQVKVSRNSIDIITTARGKLYCSFSGINQIDYTHNTFNLLLFDETRQSA